MVTRRANYRFTVKKYEEMIRAGILDENDRVELIRGEIVEKMPIGDHHVATIIQLNDLFSRLITGLVFVSSQNPIRLPDSQPEPDVCLLEWKVDFYRSGKPTPANILLLIEVADSTLEYDRTDKLTLYAENGISEYWIVNLVDEQIEVFRSPQANGTYAQTSIHRRGEMISLVAFPNLNVPVEDLLPT